jgi:uncharacterized protein VirK/YbjX
MHAFVHVRAVDRWIHIDTPSALRIELQRSTTVFKSISNPYIHSNWTMQQRMCAISTHYRLLSSLQLEFLNFSVDHYWNCVNFELGEQKFRIVVDRQPWMGDEGAMVASLFLGIDRIYAMAFSMGGEPEAPYLIVGAIQGTNNAADGTLYADLTKLFHGMRPRDLMVNITKMVAQSMGCTQLHCIADDCHQSLGRGNQFARTVKYDDIWSENHGTRNDAGFFVMDTKLHKRADEDIPARKRALYRRRYALLDDLEQRVAAAFAAEHKEIRLHGT